MFTMSEAQWVANVKGAKASGMGDYRVAPTGEYSMYMRPSPVDGLLIVTTVPDLTG